MNERTPLTRREMLAAVGAAGLAVLTFLAVGESPAAPKNTTVIPYEQTVLRKDPAAYWPLKETSGTTAHDHTANKHDGTYKGKIVHNAKNGITLKGQAYVEVRNSTAFSQPTSKKGLTVEAWMRPDTLSFAGVTSDPYIFWLGKGTEGQEEWAFRFYSNKSKDRPNRISGYIFSPSAPAGKKNLGAGAHFQDKLKVGQFMHVVVCYDPGDKNTPGAGVSIYKNGVLRSSPKTTPGSLYSNKEFSVVPKHTQTPLRFGTQDRKSFLIGGLQDVAIYPRVLTAAEVVENFKAH